MTTRVRVRGEFVTVQRVHWARAHSLLSDLGRAYDARASNGCMRLNLDAEQREILENGLPVGAVQPSTQGAMLEGVRGGL
jgi:hypothetical protein